MNHHKNQHGGGAPIWFLLENHFLLFYCSTFYYLQLLTLYKENQGIRSNKDCQLMSFKYPFCTLKMWALAGIQKCYQRLLARNREGHFENVMLGLLVKYSYQSSLVIRRDGMNGQWCSRESSNPPCSLKSSFKKCTSSAAANFFKRCHYPD